MPIDGVTNKQLFNWVNRVANTNYESISELSDAVGYCIVLKKLFPKVMVAYTAGMHERQAKDLTKEEKINNWKHVAKALKTLGIKKSVEVKRLVSGNKDNNKEFVLWFKEFYRLNLEAAEEKKKEKLDTKERTALRRVESTGVGLQNRPSFRVQGIDSEFEERIRKLYAVANQKDENEMILETARVVKAAHLLNMDVCFQNYQKIIGQLKKVKKNKKCPVWESYLDLEDCLLYSEEVHGYLKDAVNDIKQNKEIILMYHLMTEMKTVAGMISETKRLMPGMIPDDMAIIVTLVIKAYDQTIAFVADVVKRIWEIVRTLIVSEDNELSGSYKSMKSHIKNAAQTAEIIMINSKSPLQTPEEKALWHSTHWAKVTADAILFLDMSG